MAGSDKDAVIASPSVRARAAREGIDLTERARSLGRQTMGHEDLQGSTGAAHGASSTDTAYWEVDHAAYGPVHEEPMSRFAQLSARNLTAAATVIPAVTHHDSADITGLEAFRAGLKAEAQARGLRLTGLAFQVKALARALREFPRFNASLSADGSRLILKDYVHVAIAVDTAHGLMVPAIRDADRKGLWALAAEIADLAGRAQARKVRPDEMGGASMTISNLGGMVARGSRPSSIRRNWQSLG